MQKLKKRKLTPKQQAKVKRDLSLIHSISKHAKTKNIRIVVAGGYAVDGNLGIITRYHDDIDLHVYGREPEALPLLNELFREIGFDVPVRDLGWREYYHEYDIRHDDLSANIYYLQCVTHPFEEKKILVKKDGSYTVSHELETSRVNIGHHEFEALTPLSELVGKIYEVDYRKEPRTKKRDHDIHNLRQITDGNAVEEFFAVFQ